MALPIFFYESTVQVNSPTDVAGNTNDVIVVPANTLGIGRTYLAVFTMRVTSDTNYTGLAIAGTVRNNGAVVTQSKAWPGTNHAFHLSMADQFTYAGGDVKLDVSYANYVSSRGGAEFAGSSGATLLLIDLTDLTQGVDYDVASYNADLNLVASDTDVATVSLNNGSNRNYLVMGGANIFRPDTVNQVEVEIYLRNTAGAPRYSSIHSSDGSQTRELTRFGRFFAFIEENLSGAQSWAVGGREFGSPGALRNGTVAVFDLTNINSAYSFEGADDQNNTLGGGSTFLSSNLPQPGNTGVDQKYLVLNHLTVEATVGEENVDNVRLETYFDGVSIKDHTYGLGASFDGGVTTIINDDHRYASLNQFVHTVPASTPGDYRQFAIYPQNGQRFQDRTFAVIQVEDAPIVVSGFGEATATSGGEGTGTVVSAADEVVANLNKLAVQHFVYDLGLFSAASDNTDDPANRMITVPAANIPSGREYIFLATWRLKGQDSANVPRGLVKQGLNRIGPTSIRDIPAPTSSQDLYGWHNMLGRFTSDGNDVYVTVSMQTGDTPGTAGSFGGSITFIDVTDLTEGVDYAWDFLDTFTTISPSGDNDLVTANLPDPGTPSDYLILGHAGTADPVNDSDIVFGYLKDNNSAARVENALAESGTTFEPSVYGWLHPYVLQGASGAQSWSVGGRMEAPDTSANIQRPAVLILNLTSIGLKYSAARTQGLSTALPTAFTGTEAIDQPNPGVDTDYFTINHVMYVKRGGSATFGLNDQIAVRTRFNGGTLQDSFYGGTVDERFSGARRLTNSDDFVPITEMGLVSVSGSLAPSAQLEADMRVRASGSTYRESQFIAIEAGNSVANIDPFDGETEVALNKILSWGAANNAVSYNVYFDDNQANVDGRNPFADQGNQAGTTFDPGPLSGVTTYYWAVDSVNSLGDVTASQTFSFTTQAEPIAGFGEATAVSSGEGTGTIVNPPAGEVVAERVGLGVLNYRQEGFFGATVTDPDDVAARYLTVAAGDLQAGHDYIAITTFRTKGQDSAVLFGVQARQNGTNIGGQARTLPAPSSSQDLYRWTNTMGRFTHDGVSDIHLTVVGVSGFGTPNGTGGVFGASVVFIDVTDLTEGLDYVWEDPGGFTNISSGVDTDVLTANLPVPSEPSDYLVLAMSGYQFNSNNGARAAWYVRDNNGTDRVEVIQGEDSATFVTSKRPLVVLPFYIQQDAGAIQWSIGGRDLDGDSTSLMTPKILILNLTRLGINTEGAVTQGLSTAVATAFTSLESIPQPSPGIDTNYLIINHMIWTKRGGSSTFGLNDQLGVRTRFNGATLEDSFYGGAADERFSGSHRLTPGDERNPLTQLDVVAVNGSLAPAATIDQDYRARATGTTYHDTQLFAAEVNTQVALITPEDGDTTDIPPDQDLFWTATENAVSYDVYFSTVQLDVDNRSGASNPFKGNQAGTTYDPGTLTPGTTYYWAIDAVNVDGDRTPSATFSFFVEEFPAAASNPNPADGSNGAGFNPTPASWDAGLNADTYDVYFGTNQTDVTNATNASPEFLGNTALTSFNLPTPDFLTTYYWRVDSIGDAGTTKGATWSFTTAVVGTPLDLTPPPLSLVFETPGPLLRVEFPAKSPGVSRKGFAGIDDLGPREFRDFAFKGDPSVNNRLQVSSSSQLQLDPTYSGSAYELGGPADPNSDPIKLGFRPGDKIRLKGPVGGEPNDGRELTLTVPDTLSVLEELVTPDATLYEFEVIRRTV